MSIFTNFEGDFESFWAKYLKPFLHDDAEPLFKAFFKQFESEFGQQAIAAALGAVGTLTTGASFGVVAAGLASTLFSDAKVDAAKDATLTASEVLQTIQSALQVAKVANGITTPADQHAAEVIVAAAA